jgi:hypothetical protein
MFIRPALHGSRAKKPHTDTPVTIGDACGRQLASLRKRAPRSTEMNASRNMNSISSCRTSKRLAIEEKAVLMRISFLS